MRTDRLSALRFLVGTTFRTAPGPAFATVFGFPLSLLIHVLTLWWTKNLVDAVLARDVTAARISGALIGLGILWIGTFATLTGRMAMLLEERVGTVVKHRLVELTMTLPGLEHHERPEYLDRLESLHQNMRSLTMAFYMFPIQLGDFVYAAGAFVLLVRVHPALGLLPLFVVPSLLLGAHHQTGALKVHLALAPRRRLAAHLFGLATAPASGKEIRVFGLREELRHRQETELAAVAHAEHRLAIRGGLNGLVGTSISALGFVLAVALITHQALRRDASPGEVLLIVAIASQVNGLVATAAGSVLGLRQALELLGNFTWLEGYARADAGEHRADAPMPDALVHGITLEDVGFTYPGTQAAVLTGVDIHLAAGSTIAIVGENGAGKTTLVKLLAGFYTPTRGRILVDGTDLATIDIAQWRAKMTAAFQDFTRFEFTVRETVGLGDVSRIGRDEPVLTAFDRAGSLGVLDTVPQGLDTRLGTQFGGHDLSGGQWQKLALARSRMRDAPLLVLLDEPSANLDAETEHQVFTRYASAARSASRNGAVTILISHRFSTVAMADLIVVMSDGAIGELGTHDELMARGGTYAELYTLQAAGYAPRTPGPDGRTSTRG